MPIIGVIASSDRNVPNAPTIGTATNVPSGRLFNNGRADVTFTAPTYTGGRPITGYTVTSSPGGFTGTGAASPISVTGLQSNTPYTFTVTATNAIGTSAASAASNQITATTAPQAPTIGTATDLGTGTSVSVAYTANATGGTTPVTYTATSSPGGLTGTGASPITVSGLTAGTAYTFTVTASNANGSATSGPSNSVTPIQPGDFESIATLTPTSSSSVAFTSIPQTYKHLQIRIMGITNQQGIRYRYNAITTGYSWTNMSGNGSGRGLESYQNVGSLKFTGMQVPAGATWPTVAIIHIANYSTSSNAKTSVALSSITGNGTSREVSHTTGGAYSGTAFVINDITFTLDAGVLSTGTSIALYGIKG